MSDYRHMAWALVKALPALVPELEQTSIHGNGVLKSVATVRPFVIVKMGERSEALFGGHAHFHPFHLYVHDDPGSFVVIDKIIRAFKGMLLETDEQAIYQWPKENPDTNAPWDPTWEAHRGIGVRWAGDSGDLADDYYGTLVRYSSWQCIGQGA